MKDTKIEFRFFTIPEWKKEQDYLRQQHKNGWKFTRLNGIGCYHFEKCQPEDVVYQLDYNPEGLTHKSEYIQIFQDCGWDYLQDFAGYSYFRKPVSKMNGEEEIFCDDASRIDMMKRVFRGRMIPLLCIFFLIILPNIFIQSHNDTLTGHVLTGTFALLLILYIILFLWFGIQFWKYQESLRE